MRTFVYIIVIIMLFSCKGNLQEKNDFSFDTQKVEKDTFKEKINKKS